MKEMAVNLRNRARKVKARWTEELCRKSLSGITVIELVLILVIVIALLLIFKNQLINLINTIFDKIISESSGI
jgi:competence protein ComGC